MDQIFGKFLDLLKMKKEDIVSRSFKDVKESALNWALRFKFCSWFFDVCCGVSHFTPSRGRLTSPSKTPSVSEQAVQYLLTE